MSQSSRDRLSSKDDKPDDKEGEPEVVFEPSPAFVEAVQTDEPAAEAPAPPAQAPELSRDEEIAAVLDRVVADLIHLKLAYGDNVARTIGERALTLMRRVL